MQSNTSKIILAVIVTAIVVGGGVYYWQKSTERPRLFVSGSNLEFSTGAIPLQKILYTSSTHGYTLTFPKTWEGFTTKSRTLNWGTFTSDSVDFGFPVQDALFNISMHAKDQWQKIKSAEGPTPTYLGENSQFVFGYSGAQYAANDTMIARMSEVKEIVETFVVTK